MQIYKYNLRLRTWHTFIIGQPLHSIKPISALFVVKLDTKCSKQIHTKQTALHVRKKFNF